MSYMIDKFNAGEVHIGAYEGTVDNVCGWLFDSGEFRPLMADAMKELFDAGLVTQNHVDATAIAYDVHTERTLREYAEREERFWNDPEFEEARQERLFEMKAAFGEGEEVVNVFTGRRTRL